MRLFKVKLYQYVRETLELVVEAPDTRAARKVADAAVFGGQADIQPAWERKGANDTGIFYCRELPDGGLAPDLGWKAVGRDIIRGEEGEDHDDGD
jgi:hypothetical protein